MTGLVKPAFGKRLKALSLLFAISILYPLSLSAEVQLIHQEKTEVRLSGTAVKTIMFHAPNQSSVNIFAILASISSDRFQVVAGKKVLSIPRIQWGLVQEKNPEKTDEPAVIEFDIQNITSYKYRLSPINSQYWHPASENGKDIPVNLHRLRL